MKATSLKRLVLLLLLPDVEKPLNKFKTIQLKKAGFITCLFLCSTICLAQKDWLTDSQLAQSYSYVITLQIDKSRSTLSEVKTPEQIYVASLADALELLLTEDEIKFEKYEDGYEARLELLEKTNPQTAGSLFATAELRLQWAFIHLKFGHELDAAWNVRQAYLTVQECKRKFPDFVPIKKTSG